MKKLSKKQWIGVATALVVLIVFFKLPLFTSLTSRLLNPSANNQQQVMPANNESSSASSKVEISDIVIGKGAEVKNGSVVSVNYTGTFENGIKFDSSYDSKTPLQFQVGARQLIPGFENGVMGMKVGGKRQITIPPELGYGVEGRPPIIPPNSTLIFTVELMEVK